MFPVETEKEHLEGGIEHSSGNKLETKNKSQCTRCLQYLEGKRFYWKVEYNNSFGIKPEAKNRFLTPAQDGMMLTREKTILKTQKPSAWNVTVRPEKILNSSTKLI